jgi:hypothetical protein
MLKKENIKKYQKPSIVSSSVKPISYYNKRSINNAADAEIQLLAFTPIPG